MAADGLDVRGALKEVLGENFSDSQLDNLFSELNRNPDSKVIRTADKILEERLKKLTYERESRNKKTIWQNLTVDERDLLRGIFPEYDLEFRLRVNASHGFAAASRKLETFVLLDKMEVNSDTRIIDFGANWYNHMVNGRKNVHSCCPVLDDRDGSRETDRLLRTKTHIAKMRKDVEDFKFLKNTDKEKQKRKMLDIAYKFADDVEGGKEQIVCHNKAEDCYVKADYAMGIHSSYDMPIEQLVRALEAHDVKKFLGTMIFSPLIFIHDEGTLDGLKAHWSVDRKNNRIRFTFRDDYSNGYEHDYSSYLTYFRKGVIEGSKHRFYLEMLENRAGIQFFSLIRSVRKADTKSRTDVFRNFWLPQNYDMVAVKVFDYETKPKPGPSELFSRVVYYPKELVEKARSYSFKLAEKATFKDVYGYLDSINQRVLLNGENFGVPRKATMEDLKDLAIVVFLRATFDYHYSGQIMDRLNSAERTKNSIKRDTLVGAAFAAFWFKIRNFGEFETISSLKESLITWSGLDEYSLHFSEAPYYYQVDDMINSRLREDLLVFSLFDPAEKVENELQLYEGEDKKELLLELVKPLLEKNGFYDCDTESSTASEKTTVSKASTTSTRRLRQKVKKEGATKIELKDQALAGFRENANRARTHNVTEAVRRSEYFDYLRKELLQIEGNCSNSYSKVITVRDVDLKKLKAFHQKDESNVLRRTDSGSFVALINPEKSGEFEAAYTPDGMIDIESIFSDGKWRYHFDTRHDFAYVDKNTRLLQCGHKLQVLDENMPFNTRCKVTLVEGVPGCGKTYDITQRAQDADLILTVGRETKEDIKKRIEALNKGCSVMTVDSYILNSRKCFARVWLDEGLMLCPGEIDIVRDYSLCAELFVYGDRNQIPFISRVTGFNLTEERYSGFQNVENNSVSRRCPMDVAAVLSCFYEKGFLSLSKIERSLNLKKVRNLGEVPKDGYQFLTWTQNEKKELIRKGRANTLTIHEVQGKTFEKVCLVRNDSNQLSLYTSKEHSLVALSRHTKEFLYCTTNSRGGDKVAALIEEENVKQALTKGQNSTIKAPTVEDGYDSQDFQ